MSKLSTTSGSALMALTSATVRVSKGRLEAETLLKFGRLRFLLARCKGIGESPLWKSIFWLVVSRNGCCKFAYQIFQISVFVRRQVAIRQYSPFAKFCFTPNQRWFFVSRMQYSLFPETYHILSECGDGPAQGPHNGPNQCIDSFRLGSSLFSCSSRPFPLSQNFW